MFRLKHSYTTKLSKKSVVIYEQELCILIILYIILKNLKYAFYAGTESTHACDHVTTTTTMNETNISDPNDTKKIRNVIKTQR